MTEAIQLDFPTWTPIAARGREATAPSYKCLPGEGMRWLSYPDAPITIEEANALAVKGHLVTMHRHLPDRVVFEVRSLPPGMRVKGPKDNAAAVRHEIALAKADTWLAPLPPLRGVRRR